MCPRPIWPGRRSPSVLSINTSTPEQARRFICRLGNTIDAALMLRTFAAKPIAGQHLNLNGLPPVNLADIRFGNADNQQDFVYGE